MNQTRKEALKIVGNGCRVRPFDEHDVTDGTWQYVKRADAFRAVAMVCDLNEALIRSLAGVVVELEEIKAKMLKTKGATK